MRVEVKKKIIVITLMVLCTFFLALANKSLLNNKLDSVKLSKEDKERFAIKIEDSNGDYIDYNEDTWPGIGYIFNEEESKCTTKNGEIVNNVLEYSNYRVTVKTKKTVFCYLYFDIDNSALATAVLSGDYTLYDAEANYEAGTFYHYSGAYDGKRNVIYADHCWQVFRTTKNNSIKMIYNGEPAYNSTLDRYTCENDRTNTDHIGYTGSTSTQTLGASSGTTYNYYYGTGYYYDDVAGAYKLSGEVGPYNYYNDYNTVIGMYTCKKTTANANCTMGSIYYVESYYDQTQAYVFTINTGMTYDRIGKTPFNYKYNSPAYMGYMYNAIYGVLNKDKRVTMLSYVSLSSSNLTTYSNYYYGDRAEGSSTLNNPVIGSSITDYPRSWIGKYTLLSTNQSNTNSTSYYISGVTNDATPILYRAQLLNQTTKDSTANKYLFGTGYTSNGDGTVTMTGAKEISKGDWYTSYNNGDIVKGNYVCLPQTYTYDSGNHTGVCNNGINNVTSIVVYAFSYIPVNIKYGYSFEERTSTEQQDGKGRYKLVGNNDLTNSLHTISNWTTEYNTLTNSHYTCFNEEGICDTLYFVTYTSSTSSSYEYYIEIPANKTISNILDETLSNSDINTNNSSIKSMVDLWYKEHILTKEDTNHNQYSDYLDTDEIFCNNRYITNPGGWSQTGDVTTSLQFPGYTINPTYKVSCVDINGNERVIDEFSVTSGNETLTYPIGLATYGELYLETFDDNTSIIRKSPYTTGADYWLSSPRYFISDEGGRLVNSSGSLSTPTDVNFPSGVRPAVSLNADVTFSSGDGTMTNPWIASLE